MTNQNMLDQLEAIVAMSIKDKSTRKKFFNLLTTDFISLLGKNYVVRIINKNAKDDPLFKKSRYFYVFDNSKKNITITENDLRGIVESANLLLGKLHEKNAYRMDENAKGPRNLKVLKS